MPEHEDEEEVNIEHSPLTYQIGKTMKVQQLRDKMRIRGMNTKGPKKTLLNRLKYLNSTRRQPTQTSVNQDIVTEDARELQEVEQGTQSQTQYLIPKNASDDSPAHITDIPDDCLGIIFSFDYHPPHPKSVCKQWKRVWAKRGIPEWEESRSKIMKQHEYVDNELYLYEGMDPDPHNLLPARIEFDEDENKIWEVDPNVKGYRADSRGQSGPFKNMEQFEHCLEPGDEIHLFKGRHCNLRTLENLHVIGMDDDVVVTDNSCYEFVENVYFENITFDIKYERVKDRRPMGTVNSYITGRSLWMKDCLIKSDGGCAIYGFPGEYGFVNCKFVGCSSAIRIEARFSHQNTLYRSKITVIGCDFGNCGKEIVEDNITAENSGCIVIDSGIQRSEQTVEELTCVGNKFIDNLCLPIVEYHQLDLINTTLVEEAERHLSYNVLHGYNAAKVEGKEGILDANKLYRKRNIDRT